MGFLMLPEVLALNSNTTKKMKAPPFDGAFFINLRA